LKRCQKCPGLVEVFRDKRKIEAGSAWRADVDAALAQATHAVALLSRGYGLSDECREELACAVDQRSSGRGAAAWTQPCTRVRAAAG